MWNHYSFEDEHILNFFLELHVFNIAALPVWSSHWRCSYGSLETRELEIV